MLRFKQHGLIIILLCSAVLGCTKPATGVDDSGATFFVNSLEGSANPNIESYSLWKIPQSVTVKFRACLTSRASHKDLYSQDFTIEVPDTRKIYPLKTNKNGCLEWTEIIPYNHFAGQSGWAIIERDVVGGGTNLGKQRIQIAVNPWAAGEKARDGGPAVIFMEPGASKNLPGKTYPAEHGLRALSGELQGSSKLVAQNVKIKAIPEGEGNDWILLRVVVSMDPFVQSLDANGQIVYEKVKDGDFDMMTQILASNVGADMNQKMLLLGGDSHASGRVTNGELHAEFKVRQDRRANQGNLELVMKISPRGLNAYRKLGEFNGLFRFGSGTVIAGDASGVLANSCNDDDNGCVYEEIIKTAANYKDLGKYVVPNERYIFSTLKLRFVSILPGETTTQRTVGYSAQTCITDITTGKPLAKTPMVIRYLPPEDQKERQVDREPSVIEDATTDESGCLTWNGRAFHKYYMPEHFYRKEVVIQKGMKTGTKEPLFERHLVFYLNPWDDKFTFGWDSREFSEKFLGEVVRPDKIPSRFFVSDYGYHTVRFLYNIDQFMELEVRKWVLMYLVPQVLRYSGIVNARKMVERLRDGIYLMKVAIEKDYLDPRDNSGLLLKNAPNFQATMQKIGDRELRSKQFITTNMALVRVVDGVIIYPMEFTMRDLRLMRVRSNMLFQLEMVDERLVQAYNVFRNQSIKDENLEQKLKEFKQKLKDGESLVDVRKQLSTNESAPDLERFEKERQQVAQGPDMPAAREDLEKRVLHIQEMVKNSVVRLKNHFEAPVVYVDELDGNGQKTGKKIPVNRGENSLEGFATSEDVGKDLKLLLKVNDFSTVTLPRKEEIDLNIFAEKDTGLEQRSFVGPVIFLSNAYSDSVRATDNLDEANCTNPDKDKDAFRDSLETLESSYELGKEINKSENALFNNRQNNAYQYNKYFNSLHHLCYIKVDDLIKQEEKLKEHWTDATKAASLKYNYVKSFNLNFISLSDEPLMKVKDDCKNGVETCLVETGEETLKASVLDDLVNKNLEHAEGIANTNLENIVKRFHGVPFRADKPRWEANEYADLFYTKTPETKAALCNLVANKIAHDLVSQKLSSVSEYAINEKINMVCSLNDGLIQDIKDRVEQTGKYTFLGGLNLNFNVGEGFSVGTSTGWSAGIELTDIVGAGSALTGAGGLKSAAAVLKPFNVKYGTGMSSSEGTSISESMYLVSQIAGFDVVLSAYERCATIRLSDESVKRMASSWGDSKITRAIGLGTANFSDPKVMQVFQGGFFICEGVNRKFNQPKTVQESYFYFTQHFTEGDMLDQAELYNSPWLFALRGMRDFTVFVQRIRAQQVVNLPDFLYHLTGTADTRSKGWALEHLGTAYRNVMPTFPGFYTELDPDEPRLNVFALQQATGEKVGLSKVDTDPLHEVYHPRVMLPENADHVQAPPKADAR